MSSSLKSLYICYFGLREPLVQTQVLPYLRELAKCGIGVTLLTFEPDIVSWDDGEVEAQRAALSEVGIAWEHRKYHKRPSVPATAYDILAGALCAARLVRDHQIDVVHCRAHIPLAMGLILKCLTGCRLIFDIRGFMADEYSDAGVWKKGSLPYLLVKRLESKGIRRSDQIVVLTEKAKNHLVTSYGVFDKKVKVIPCCVAFPKEDQGDKPAKRDRFELIYAGSVTGLYLLREMAQLFIELKKQRPGAFFRILTFGDRETVGRVLGERGIEETDYAVESVTPERIPDTLSKAHLGVSFRKPTFAQIAASPTKIPEYLSAGIPVITNSGIGDTDDFVRHNGVGVVIEEFSHRSLSRAVREALELIERGGVAERCREAAIAGYSLEHIGGPRYLSVYEKIYKSKLGRD